MLYDSFPRDHDMKEPLFVVIDGHVVPLFMVMFSRRGVRGATAIFADIDSPARASEFVGREFSIRVALSEGEESTDLESVVGWTAEVAPGRVGRVTDYFGDEMNPLFEVEIDGERVLIPVVDEFIVGFDESARRIVFALPKGLLELNN